MMRGLLRLLAESGSSRSFVRYLWLTWLDVLLMALPPLAAAEFIRQACLQGGWPTAGAYWLGIALAAPLLRFCVQWRARMLGVEVVFAAITCYRRQLVRHMLDAPWWQLREWSASQLLDRLGGDVRQVQEGIFIALVRLQVNLLLAAILLLYVGFHRPEVLAGFLVLLVLCALVGRSLLSALAGRVDALNARNAAVRRVLSDVMQGIRTLRLFQAIRLPALGLDALLLAQQEAQRAAVPAFALRDQTFHGLLELCLIAGLLAAWVVQVDASLVPVLLVLPLAYHNLYCAWQEWSLLKWTRQAWQRVRLLVELESQVQGDTPLLPGPQALALESAGFDHSGSAVLDAVQACFQPGTHTVIVGRNGAGKSTLLMVLARLYDLRRGRLLLGGIASDTASLEAWRSYVAVVMQDTALLPGTLRENLLLGRADADDEALRKALTLACCDFVDLWGDGLDTLLGEGGIAPSGGERQRIAIARALLKDAPIVLLDEVTSGLDSDSAWRVQMAIAALAGERTVIQVTHVLQQAVHADQVLVLDDGRVVERGAHACLLSAGGVYATLWEMHQNSLKWEVAGSAGAYG